MKWLKMTDKRITLRIDADLYKKLTLTATCKDESVNEYIISLITADVDNVDLSAIINE